MMKNDEAIFWLKSNYDICFYEDEKEALRLGVVALSENERLKEELHAMAKGEKKKWVNEISQFLQNNGFENASKAIDCKYDL